MEHIKVDPNQAVEIEKLTENVPDLPASANWKTLFRDVFGRPGRRFYDFLSVCATDETEKAELKNLLSKEGKPELKNFVDETATFAEYRVSNYF